MGVMLAAAAYAVSLSLFIWMMPVTIGLLLSIPLAALTSRTDVGLALQKMRLLIIPEEQRAPEILVRANCLAVCLQDEDVKIGEILQHNADLRKAHSQMLPPQQQRQRGDINRDLVVAKAKTEEATTLHEAIGFLTPMEMRAVLSDPQAYQLLLSKLQSSPSE
jgi:membrane glycosyltransferase